MVVVGAIGKSEGDGVEVAEAASVVVVVIEAVIVASVAAGVVGAVVVASVINAATVADAGVIVAGPSCD